MFPKSTIGTLTGIAQFAAGTGSFLINKGAGKLFTFAAGSFSMPGSDKAVELSRDAIARAFTPATVTFDTFFNVYSQFSKLAILDRFFARLSKKAHELKSKLHATVTTIKDFFI